MIEVYKILTNKYDNNVNLNLQQSQNSITRGQLTADVIMI